VDEARISKVEIPPSQIQFDAARTTPFENYEVLLPLKNVAMGSLSYQVDACTAVTRDNMGVPITNLKPASMLLPAGSASLSFDTVLATRCAYSVNSQSSFANMTPFPDGQGTTSHFGTISGLSSDSRTTNRVYLQCESDPAYVVEVRYRVLATAPAYPNIGSIWWGSYIYQTDSEKTKKIRLFLGPNLSASTAKAIRSTNPSVLILPAVSAQEAPNGVTVPGLSPPSTPDSYYMKDIEGNRIATYPGGLFMINMTRPEVAEFVAQYVYRLLVESDFAFDGVFFDNFSLDMELHPIRSALSCHGRRNV